MMMCSKKDSNPNRKNFYVAYFFLLTIELGLFPLEVRFVSTFYPNEVAWIYIVK